MATATVVQDPRTQAGRGRGHHSVLKVLPRAGRVVEDKRPQHLRALDGANEIRLAMATISRAVRRQPSPVAFRFVAGIIEAPATDIERKMLVGRLLGNINRVGPTRTRKFLSERHGFGRNLERRRIGELTQRERTLLGRVLREAAQR